MDNSLELTEIDIGTLTALMDAIIPADYFPSASGAGVLNYMQRILATDMKTSKDWYITGLSLLNSEAQTRCNCSFAHLTCQQRCDVVAALEKGITEFEWSISPAEFVRISVNLVSEGYYADPGNGGNTDAVSWKMIGFEVIEGIRLPVESLQ
jgi:gluconate 2-dehydrogenase gamma chain